MFQKLHLQQLILSADTPGRQLGKKLSPAWFTEGVTSVEASCHCNMFKTKWHFDRNSMARTPEVLDFCSAFTSSKGAEPE